MLIKVLMYILTVPLSIVALDSINIQNIFKKNRYWQSRLLVFMLSMALSYLVVNFLFDFFDASRFI